MRWTTGLLAAVLLAPSSTMAAADYQVGVAKVDITPTDPIRMAGYGNRNKPSEGVEQHLFTKALVIQHGDQPPLVLVTADIIGFRPYVTEPAAQRLHRQFGIPRQNVLFIGSHTHAGPIIYDGLPGMFQLRGQEADTVRKYADKLRDHICAAVAQAMKDRRPAHVSFGRGRASFAMNRRIFTPNGVNFGANPDGLTDHEVPVLRVDDDHGRIRAVVFGYACHCTTLTGDYYRICGDWAGYAQEYLERAIPGALAFFATGCGGDANPEPRGTVDLAREHGLEMAGAVSKVLKHKLMPVHGELRTAFDHVELPLAPIPGQAFYEKRLHDHDPFVRRHAQTQLDLLKRDGKLRQSYPCPVQVWQLGHDLTLAAMGGEVCVKYALRLKREVHGGPLWVAGYANDVFAYIPSVQILLEGGYEADYNLIYYGLPTRFSNQVEDVLIRKVKDLIRQVRP